MVTAIQLTNGGTGYFNMGPSLRLSICNKLDFGAAVAFPVSDPHMVGTTVRAEIRFLY